MIPLVNKRLGMKENDLPVFLACALTVTGRFCAGMRGAPSLGSLHSWSCSPCDGGLLSEPGHGAGAGVRQPASERWLPPGLSCLILSSLWKVGFWKPLLQRGKLRHTASAYQRSDLKPVCSGSNSLSHSLFEPSDPVLKFRAEAPQVRSD